MSRLNLHYIKNKFYQKKTAPFSKEDFEKDVGELFLRGLTLEKDIKGEILEVNFAPLEEKLIPHGLRSLPQYRIILRHSGNGLITDVPSKWSDKAICLKNNGNVAVTIKIKLIP